MKTLSNLKKRTEIIAFLVGFVTVVYVFFFFPAKYFIVWHALPNSPEPATKIISTDHMGNVVVDTISKGKFECNIYNEKGCWSKLNATNYEPPNLGKTLCFMKDCPTHVVQIRENFYNPFGFAEVSTIYSLHDNGIVYIKHAGIVYWPGYLMGMLGGSFLALIAYISKQYFKQ